MNLKKRIMQCLFLMMGMMALLTSCHSDDDVESTPAPTPEVTKPVTYTIMLYGCGGGNLDEGLLYNLDQITAHGKTDRVNFAGLVKFSKHLQSEATMEGTRLFKLTSDGMKNEKVYEASYRMDNPAHLAQFIKDTKESMPADKYILIFWNHGEEFGMNDKLPSDADYTEQPSSRSILLDDNVDNDNSKSLSAYEIEKGIKDSGVKMDLIYMDLCNYGMAEVNYQLRDCSRYLMAAAAPTPGIGGNYSELIETLQTNDSLEDAIKEYVPNCMRNWKNSNVNKVQEDLECYDLSYMDEFAGYLKGAVGEFRNTVKEAEEKQEEMDASYDGVVYIDFYGFFTRYSDYLHVFDGNNYSVDVCSAFTSIANYTLNGTMSHYATQMKRILDKMTVARAAIYLPSWMDEVSMGMVWPTNSFYDCLQYENELGNNLKRAPLYQATGWGDLIANLRTPENYKVTSPQEKDVYVSSVYKGHKNYTWQYDVELDLSNVEDAVLAQNLYSLCKIWAKIMNSKAEMHPCILGLGKYIFDEAKNYLSEPVFGNDSPLLTDVLNYCGINKLQLKVYVKDGVSPDDPDQDKFPSEIVEEIKLDE